jgi:hypothetical protein
MQPRFTPELWFFEIAYSTSCYGFDEGVVVVGLNRMKGGVQAFGITSTRGAIMCDPLLYKRLLGQINVLLLITRLSLMCALCIIIPLSLARKN